MATYEINANLTTELFQKNYTRYAYFICKTVDFIENDHAIDNYYFFSHNQFFRLTEYKDHINKKIYISDEKSDKFDIKQYGENYDTIYTIPMEDEKLQSTGIDNKSKIGLTSFIESIYDKTEIFEVNTNLNNFLIITNGKMSLSDSTKPIGIICYQSRIRVEKDEFFDAIKIPIIQKSIDDKINEYKKEVSRVVACGNYPEKLENIIL